MEPGDQNVLETSTSTAIHDLPDDILLEIFTMNADLRPGEDWPDDFSSSPLTTTRRTSQVCRRWRHLLLSSPLIWGRIIDVDFLDQRNRSWRKEVLRRCGDAHLHIRSLNRTSNKWAEALLFHILKTAWERIRVLDVRGRYWSPEVWAIYHSANPTIEFFRVTGITILPQRLTSSRPLEGQLFANHAPSLRYINISFSLESLPLDAPWRAHIRHLTLAPFIFDIPKLLSALKHMECLESLEIVSRYGSLDPPTSTPSICMPRLRDIKCKSTAALKLLDFVFPARGCRLTLELSDILSGHNSNLVFRIFSRFLQDQVALSHRLEDLCLEFSDQRTRIEFGHLQYSSSASAGRFPLAITMPSMEDFENLVLGSLTGWGITPGLKALQLGSARIRTPNFYAPYISFFQSLTSLQELHVPSSAALAKLYECRHAQPAAFPVLETIHIHNPPISGWLVGHFLSWRVQCGLPVVVLDLTAILEWPEVTEPDRKETHSVFNPLEKFQGLEIRWRGASSSVESYICGSGFIERLKPWEK